ncbi:phosphoglycerate mutase-like protein [Rickenella mellea]|uniref:Phosphoglycerate mutase-like protein n=1 Tax=Rickenella mellea TaxID=50990 RepID=A0A4Y7QC65_9AGAM|nr:phosphoglycerate mutase-like protein [Rickenella mellea]
MPARIYVVRHGETAENREGIIQGQLDTTLNESGVIQAQVVAEALRDIPFTAAFSSDLQRAAKTAEAILSYHPSISLIRQPALRERYMGELQGIKVQRGQPARKEDSLRLEKMPAFTARILSWWQESIVKPLSNLPAGQEEHVLVVSHGAFIATLVRGLAYSEWIPREGVNGRLVCLNTSVTTLEMGDDKKWRLVKYADVSHFLKPELAVQINYDDRHTERREA